MTMRQGYAATISVLIPALSQAEACDAMSEILSSAVEEGSLVDWGYILLGGQRLSPTERYYEDAYIEGSFLV